MLGAVDPNLRLFLGAMKGDVSTVQNAADQGADINARFGDVIRALPPEVLADEEISRLIRGG